MNADGRITRNDDGTHRINYEGMTIDLAEVPTTVSWMDTSGGRFTETLPHWLDAAQLISAISSPIDLALTRVENNGHVWTL